MMEKERPRVGIGVMLLKEGKVLLGKRNGDPEKADSDLHGEGSWTMPGGKLEFKEELKKAAERELLEETGIKANELKLISVSNSIVPDKHFVTVGWLCTNFEGEAKAMEPDEITEWKWWPLDKLPEKIFAPSKRIIKSYTDKRVYDEGKD